MRRLVGAFVVRKPHEERFSRVEAHMIKLTCYICPLLVFFCRNHSASNTPPSICAPYNCIAAGYNELCPLHDINSSHEPEAETPFRLINGKCSKITNTSCLLKKHRQTVQTQIRLLLKKQSYHVLPFLLF